MVTMSSFSQWLLCPQCDKPCQLPILKLGTKASCSRCHVVLKTERSEPEKRVTAYALSALLMLILANGFPFIGMHVAGVSNQITLLSITDVLVDKHYRSLASLFILLVQAIPASCLILAIILSNNCKLPTPLTLFLGRWLFRLRSFGMAEIFMAGILVSFVKLMAYGDISLGISFWCWCLFCLLQLLSFQYLDRRRFWQRLAPLPPLPFTPVADKTGLQQGLRSCPCCTAIVSSAETICPRCYSVGHARKTQSLQWCTSLLITSIMLYIPANFLPIMYTELLGNATGSNIMAGVILLWSEGSWPIALVIFIASIMVPSLKMLAIALLTWNASGRGQQHNSSLNLIYEVVEFVGRWSMIDVFVIAILSALVQLGGIVSIYPAWGAICFALVVILTMFSSQAFDPRLLWDREAKTNNEATGVNK